MFNSLWRRIHPPNDADEQWERATQGGTRLKAERMGCSPPIASSQVSQCAANDSDVDSELLCSSRIIQPAQQIDLTRGEGVHERSAVYKIVFRRLQMLRTGIFAYNQIGRL